MVKIYRSKAKRVYRKKKTYTKKSKKGYNGKHYASDKMVIYNHPRMPIPQKYRCRFETFVDATLGTTVVNGTASFDVSINSLYRPWVSIPVVGARIDSITGITLKDGYSGTSLQPQGYSNLAKTATGSGLYTVYRVYGSKIEVEFLPATTLDNVEVMIVPYYGQNRPSNQTAAIMDRFCVKKMFSLADTRKLVKYISVAELFGINKQAIKDDISGGYQAGTTGIPFQNATWMVGFRDASNQVFQAAASLRVRVIYWAELFNEVASNELTV